MFFNFEINFNYICGLLRALLLSPPSFSEYWLSLMFYFSLMPEFITARKYGYNCSMVLHKLHGYHFRRLVHNSLYICSKYPLQVLLINIGMSPNYWHARHSPYGRAFLRYRLLRHGAATNILIREPR